MAKATLPAKGAPRDGRKPRVVPETPQFCTLPRVPERELTTGIRELRARLIRVNEKKWANGTVLHYYFFDRQTDGAQGAWVGPAAQREVVRGAFKAWKDLGLGLRFVEVDDREDAEIRIGFDSSGGSWSYVGRDVIDLVPDPNERTMNFGWDLTTAYGWDTALHEIGHTLGFPHEHQNPNSGIQWDEEAVLTYFAGSPNFWSPTTTHWNILRKLSPTAVIGSGWDPDSIMHYAFPAGLIRRPAQYASGLQPEDGLSQTDVDEARRFYPTLADERETELRPYESQRLLIGPGEQIDFRIRPTYTKRYTIQTLGVADTVIVLFEDGGNEPSYIAGDDDSGYDRNARIRERLYRDREYILRVRLYYADVTGQTAVLLH